MARPANAAMQVHDERASMLAARVAKLDGAAPDREGQASSLAIVDFQLPAERGRGWNSGLPLGV